MEEASEFCEATVIGDLGLLTSLGAEDRGRVEIACVDLKDDRSPKTVAPGGLRNVDCEMNVVTGVREVSVVNDLVLLTSSAAEQNGDVNIGDNVLRDEGSAETVMVSESRNMECDINVSAHGHMRGKKRKRGVEMNKLKEEPEVEFVGRVLRSRSETEPTQFGVSDVKMENMWKKKRKKKKERGRPQKKLTWSDDEHWHYAVGSSVKKGRSRKKHTWSDDEDWHYGVESFEKKKGRSHKKYTVFKDENVNNDVERSERKRGRPRKMPLMLPQNNHVKLKEMSGYKGKMKSKKLKMTCRTEVVDNEKRFALRQSHVKCNGGNAVKTTEDLNQKENDAPSRKDSMVVNSCITEKRKNNDGLPSRKSEKQQLRARIQDMLLSAGWTIDYRPRNGRNYMDAVYISPNGKNSLWSITLAYSVFKQQYEDGTHNTGFVFKPIPDEELCILRKVIKKRRKKYSEDGDSIHCEQNNSVRKSENRISKIERQRKSLHNKTQNKRRCTLLARNSGKDGNDYIPYSGKRSVLGWMIDLGIATLKGKVKYMNPERTNAMHEGTITRDGIYCGCCNKTVTVSEFETHSGSKLFEASQNICLETGNSLLQCELDAWNKQCESERCGFHLIDVSSDDPNDDSCGLCGDGGELICCDDCPSAFHQSCLNIQNFPSGDWHCIYCSCKFCGSIGCMNNGDDEPAPQLSICYFCGAKYHHDCVRSEDAHCDGSNGLSFCGTRCEELFEKLQMLVGVKHKLEDGFSCTFIRRSEITSDMCINDVPAKIECNAMVAVAYHVMDECFVPIIDQRSGINLIHNILYNCGSNMSRLNFSGFITAVLQRGDEIISAATIRIHGNQVAEMPFIGTRNIYRRQGMCRRLLSAIESILQSICVERLVIPAIAELLETWTKIFGFKPVDTSSRKEFKHMNMLVFPGTDLLQKSLVEEPKISNKNMFPSADVKPCDLKEVHNPVFSGGSDNKSSLIDTSSVTCERTKLSESTLCPILHVYSRHFRARDLVAASKTEPMETISCEEIIKQDCIPDVSVAIDSEQRICIQAEDMEPTSEEIKQDCVPHVPVTHFCEQKTCIETEETKTVSCAEIVKEDLIPDVPVAIDCERETCIETERSSSGDVSCPSKQDLENGNLEMCGSNIQFNSESFCSLKSTSGVDFLSASGGSSACCIPEVG